MNRFPFIFPLAILAFAGSSYTYLDRIFTASTRWGFLGLLLLSILFSFRKISSGHWTIMLLFLYAVWGVTTSIWSEAMDLSLLKSSVFAVVSFTFYFAGSFWGEVVGRDRIFDFLFPVLLMTFVSSLLGYFLSPFAFDGDFFQGFVHGSNMLGFLIAISAPCVLWKYYKADARTVDRMLYGFMAAALAYFLYLSHSRAAMLAVFCVLATFLYVVSLKRALLLAGLISFLIVMMMTFNPEALKTVIHDTVFKKSNTLLYTRAQTWEESFAQAQKGGLLGGGYGVTIGSDAWKGGFSAVGYGREKGNSQLAVTEETGLVGLFLYSLLMISIFLSMISALGSARGMDERVAMALCLGAIAGFFVNSCFEAWWVAPGSFESVAFWSVVGVATGISSSCTD